jgi:S-adenosylmethionine hydrolase
MAIVTLLTDAGESDHYVASIKAKIISLNPGIRIEDISHSIKPADIAHAAFVLRAVFHDFPKGTVHLVGVDSTGNRGDAFIALQLEDHFFVGCDNGLFGLISERPHQQLVELNAINTISTTFPERDIFAHAASKLASGV